MDQTGQVCPSAAAGPQGHVEGIQGQIGAQGGGDLPAQHDPGEHVQDERDVDPAGMRADVGQVRHPQLVRSLGDELPLDQVLGAGCLGPVRAGGVEGLGPWVMPRNPSARISRSTVQRATCWPCRWSSAWTFLAP